ncbi:C1 family peptidase [Hufsiella ginkgonis]|uniref:Peptidase C1A papain C-terminal domain-containing protein n=1 Tax=Hufsiella ginkgonis TaxID=2695274 RepID=A0A7K1XY99_9SPHI|nr:C1 family peptidase [Hufsiella ginkgonis]MXV15971.1 hypothetical protein [Hufsiella ginkgonis]
MKKHYLAVLWAFLLVLTIGSCKKNQPGASDEAKPKHGLGAILDNKAYQKIQPADFNEIRKTLSKLGYSADRVSVLPGSVILNHPAAGDQGFTGTCVSWSIGYALMGTLNNEFPTVNVVNPRSGWYIYQKDHSAVGNCSDQDGMTIVNGMTIATNSGVPAESLDPSLGSPCVAPSSTVNADAATNKVLYRYGTISNLTQIKTALSLHLPVEMGFNVFDSFDDAFFFGTTFSSVSGNYRGAHAVCIVGYDDAKNAVLIQNSWGTFGGDATYPGCMWLDYGVLFNGAMGTQLFVASPDSGSPQEVFEFYNSSLGNHALSLNYGLPSLHAGWNHNAQPFKAYAKNLTGTVPVYQFLNNSNADHVYTTNRYPGFGPYYVYDGIVFYAYSYNAPGTVPVYEFWHGSGDHFYSTNINAASPFPGWTYNGLPFYTLPN